MGDLALDTAVRPLGDGRFEATLSRDWEIWGPNGGYVAAVALRAAGAAGAAAGSSRPAAFSCHFLNVADFGPVDVAVETRRSGRTASSHRIEVSQGERRILDAMVWTVGEADGLEHDEAVAPDVPGPEALRTLADLVPNGELSFPFWDNIDARPLDREDGWPPPGPKPARYGEWMRFRPTASFTDPWVDAARSLILIDIVSWPSAQGPHAWQQPPYIAPTLDLNVSFHRPSPDAEWLLVEGTAPVATGGLFGWTGRVWSQDGRLHATGGGQCLYRRIPG